MLKKYSKFKLVQFIIIFILIIGVIDNINLTNFIAKFNINFVYAILISQIPMFIALYFTSLRHLYFVNNDKLTKKIAFNAILIGSGFNNILPGRISELIKASYIRKQCDISFSIGIGAVFLERLIDVLFLFILSVISILVFSFKVDISIIVILTMVLLVFLYVLLKYQHIVLSTINKFIKHKKINSFIVNLLSHIQTQITTKKIIVGILFGFIIWIFSIINVGLFLNIAGDIYLDYDKILVLVVAGAIGYAIPALPGGLGTFEAMMVMMLMKYGYDFDTSVALAIGIRLSNIIIVLPYSLYLSFRHGTGLGKIMADLKDKDCTSE